MVKGHKIKLYPTSEQAEKIIQFCNASRYAYNWALAKQIENFRAEGKILNKFKLAVLFTEFKKEEENKWLKQVSGRAMKVAIMNCAVAYDNYFKGNAKLPKFKSKKKSKMSCATHEGTTLIEQSKIRLEKLGWVKCAKHTIKIQDGLKIYNPKISFDGVDFWFSVGIETESATMDKPKTEPIGIDLGLKTLATCSNGIINHKPNIKKEQKKLKRLQRKASRHYLGMKEISKQTKIKFVELEKSKNLLKLEKQVKKQYVKITNILNNNIHNFTKSLVNLNPEAIVIEDLDTKSMIKNKNISRAMREAKFYEIRRQLVYKCEWNNIKLIIASRWFPSSKMCSECGSKKDKLSLSIRTYVCEDCGSVLDRDLNAAYNLRNLAYAT